MRRQPGWEVSTVHGMAWRGTERHVCMHALATCRSQPLRVRILIRKHYCTKKKRTKSEKKYKDLLSVRGTYLTLP